MPACLKSAVISGRSRPMSVRPASHDSRKAMPNPSATLVVSIRFEAARFSEKLSPPSSPMLNRNGRSSSAANCFQRS